MKLITRDIDYAIRALCHIANSEKEIVSVTELVKGLEIPRPFLRKILQVLHRSAILKSYRGKNGGFLLALSPVNILLTDIIEAFRGPMKLSDCLFKNRICPDVKSCMLKNKIDSIERGVISGLKSITIQSLLKEGNDGHKKC
ncbi:MAG: Rrf2 family transcriptional regulator [Candidatus Omnitrophica bacterium]|nr:Rrf2 family transcriptional regulator [Candidatus Omnitrophota bacterium]